MNNKGQYDPRPMYANVHPIFIIGITMFMIPFILPIMNIDPAPWLETFFRWVGVILIIIGAAFSIYNISN